MARRHFAKALLSEPGIEFDRWMESLRGQHEGAVPKDHVHRIAKTVLRKCDPQQYLLSHATIVASVDTYAPKRSKVGKSMNRGVEIDVRWPDFRVRPECRDIINNNGDAWERSLLLSTYRTFIGAHNYLEHIQLPELSKGFIVDAIARDLGKTCYIDILVATDRKHTTLVNDIITGKIAAMSMGCISLFTICSKCGNVAADDSQVCPCVQYEGKRTAFVDEDGVEHLICEIIGHVSVPQSNQFIEASWVRTPAFTGAQRRNFLNADMSPALAAQIIERERINQIRTSIPEIEGLKKAASVRTAEEGQQTAPDGTDDTAPDGMDDTSPSADSGGGDDTQGGLDQGGGDDGSSEPSTKPETPNAKRPKLDELLDKAQEQLLEIMVKGLGEKLAPKPEDVGSVNMSINKNENLISSSEQFNRLVRNRFAKSPELVRWASHAWRIVHEGGLPAIRQAGLKPRDLIVLSWIEDQLKGRHYSASLYKLAMKIGPMSTFPSETSFVAACSLKAGRQLNNEEVSFLKWKGRLASIAQF